MLPKGKGVQREGTRGECIGNSFSLTICLNVNLVVPGRRIECTERVKECAAKGEASFPSRPLSSLLDSCATDVVLTGLTLVSYSVVDTGLLSKG